MMTNTDSALDASKSVVERLWYIWVTKVTLLRIETLMLTMGSNNDNFILSCRQSRPFMTEHFQLRNMTTKTVMTTVVSCTLMRLHCLTTSVLDT